MACLTLFETIHGECFDKKKKKKRERKKRKEKGREKNHENGVASIVQTLKNGFNFMEMCVV